MESSRTYGDFPYKIVLVHGGPGAPGYLAPLAKKLAGNAGAVELLNSASTIEDQLFELCEEIIRQCDLPVILIGHSWGAWLCWIFASKYSNLIKKLIIIGAPPFEAKFTHDIFKTRMSRLDESDQEMLSDYLQKLDSHPDKNHVFEKIGNLLSKADTLDPITDENHVLEYQYNIYKAVWDEAEKMRQSGELLNLGKNISCPVIAIHGNYDPHPFQGVHQPLSKMLTDFKMHIIDKCGHYPWNERQAVDDFYRVLISAIEN